MESEHHLLSPLKMGALKLYSFGDTTVPWAREFCDLSRFPTQWVGDLPWRERQPGVWHRSNIQAQRPLKFRSWCRSHKRDGTLTGSGCLCPRRQPPLSLTTRPPHDVTQSHKRDGTLTGSGCLCPRRQPPLNLTTRPPHDVRQAAWCVFRLISRRRSTQTP